MTVDIRRRNSLIAIGGQPRLWRVSSLSAGPRRVLYNSCGSSPIERLSGHRPIQFHLGELRTDSLVGTHDRSDLREPNLLGPIFGHLVSQSSRYCTLFLPCTSFRRHEGECRRVAVVEHVVRQSGRQTHRCACVLHDLRSLRSLGCTVGAHHVAYPHT